LKKFQLKVNLGSGSIGLRDKAGNHCEAFYDLLAGELTLLGDGSFTLKAVNRDIGVFVLADGVRHDLVTSQKNSKHTSPCPSPLRMRKEASAFSDFSQPEDENRPATELPSVGLRGAMLDFEVVEEESKQIPDEIDKLIRLSVQKNSYKSSGIAFEIDLEVEPIRVIYEVAVIAKLAKFFKGKDSDDFRQFSADKYASLKGQTSASIQDLF